MRFRRSFWTSLSTSLGAGLPLTAALDHALSGASPRLATPLREAVRGGRPLAEGMVALPGEFDPFQVALVRAAETTGTLEETSRALADLEEERDRVRGRVLVSCAYPVVVLLGTPVPLNVGILVRSGVGPFLKGYLWTALPFVLPVVVAAVAWSLPGGRRFLVRLLLAMPVVGALMRDRAWARWARAMAAMEDAGVPADRAARECVAVMGLGPVEDPLLRSSLRLGGGTSRTEAFHDAGLPRDLFEALRTGEDTGSLGPSLLRAAKGLEASAETRTGVLLSMLPVAATVLAGAAVLYAAFTILGSAYRF